MPSKTDAKPKPHPKPATGLAPIFTILPFTWAPKSEAGLGYVENCASYTGCTEEEYCQTWGLKCDLVQTPVKAPAREVPEKDAA